MDILQIALIFLIALLTIFLTTTGVQVFFILRDLKKALDRFHEILKSDEIKERIDSKVKTARTFPTTSRRLFKKVR